MFSPAFLPLTFGQSGNPVRSVVNPLSCWIGKLGYDIYLIYFGVIYLLKLVSPQFDITGNQTINFSVCLVAVTAATTGLSFI